MYDVAYIVNDLLKSKIDSMKINNGKINNLGRTPINMTILFNFLIYRLFIINT